MWVWAEIHILVGISVQLGFCGYEVIWLLIPATLISMLFHWPLDDINIGHVAKVYHGTGRGKLNIATTVLRIPIWGTMGYLFWLHPALLICGLSGWLVLDHEWIFNLSSRHGYGLHERMWPKWAYGQRGLIIIFAAMALLLVSLVFRVL